MKSLNTGLRAIAKVVTLSAFCVLLFLNGPVLAATGSYSDLQRSQIEKFEVPLLTAQERMVELGQSVTSEDWTSTRNFIHGPLGDLRRTMANINRNLQPKEQGKARKQARALMSHIETLDRAAQDKNSRLALREYKETVSELDVFLQFVPQF